MSDNFLGINSPNAALVSVDKTLQDLFVHACECCTIVPIIADSGFALSRLLSGKTPNQFIVDMNLPAEATDLTLMVPTERHNWGGIPVTAIHSTLHHTVSSRYMFSRGITASIDRSISHQDLTTLLSSQMEIWKRWSIFSDDAVLDEKMRICINSMKLKNIKCTCESRLEQTFAEKIDPRSFSNFIESLCSRFSMNSKEQRKMRECMPEFLYQHAESVGIPRAYVLQHISDYLMLPHITSIDIEKLQHSVFPPQFCRSNKIIPLRLDSINRCLVLGEPFDWELIEFLIENGDLDNNTRLYVADPELLEEIFALKHVETEKQLQQTTNCPKLSHDSKTTVELENYIFEAAVKERATDIHIEPKVGTTVIRFRVDGDLHDFTNLKSVAVKLICRLKGRAGIDISESRRPQDGCFQATIIDKQYRIRVASTLTQFGESLSLRFLKIESGLKNLVELGMHDTQEQLILSLSMRHSGMLLFVGPTGSGKTTTIYSTLNHVDCQTRSLISVEDPIEYSIPHANQQQVNEKSGNNYEVLLKSSVRQDPDILFVGEIRDTSSAKIAMDFTSTGRLTLTSMHTTNATTALFRLERLGISRVVISEAVLAIIAQRLIKKLCNGCKKIMPISDEDRTMLTTYFGNDIPELVAYPSGCSKCNYTGYYDRTGIYEIMHFTPEIAEMVANSKSISEIRQRLVARGDFMMPYHAFEKIKDMICSPADIQSAVLLEESAFPLAIQPAVAFEAKEIHPERHHSFQKTSRLLIVEDNTETAIYIERYLTTHGFTVDIAANGMDALVKLGSKNYGIILSDVMMPDLDGFKLLEIMKQKNIETPVILMTALSDENSELHGLELGAVDYIHKPIKLEILKMRIDRFMYKPEPQ